MKIEAMDLGLFAVQGQVFAGEDHLFRLDSSEIDENLDAWRSGDEELSNDFSPALRKALIQAKDTGATVYVGSSYSTHSDSSSVVIIGKLKPLVRGVESPGDFFAALPRFANLLAGTKAIEVSRYAEFGVWERKKGSEYIVFLGDDD